MTPYSEYAPTGFDSRGLALDDDHRSQFEPRSFVELLQCVRGHFFLGYASELIEDS